MSSTYIGFMNPIYFRNKITSTVKNIFYIYRPGDFFSEWFSITNKRCTPFKHIFSTCISNQTFVFLIKIFCTYLHDFTKKENITEHLNWIQILKAICCSKWYCWISFQELSPSPLVLQTQGYLLNLNAITKL